MCNDVQILSEEIKRINEEWLRKNYENETDLNFHNYLAMHLNSKLVTKSDEFDYGIVMFKHRFSIKRSLNDYKETILEKCIRIGLELKYKTVACDKLIYELQILYKDDNNKIQCLCKDLENWTFEILQKGNMMVHI